MTGEPVKIFSKAEVAQHNSKNSCWCIIHGKVYDLTNFLPEHPGGENIILKYAGKDATKAFEPIHPPDIIDNLLPSDVKLGEIEFDPEDKKKEVDSHFDVIKKKRPHIDTMINIFDFEAVAKKHMKKDAWSYYSSGAEDEITLRDNRGAFQRIWLIPRILVNVKEVSLSSTILDQRSSLPMYISATALGKLGHPEGEVVLTRAAGSRGLIQMLPTLSSCSLSQMIEAKKKDQVQFMQLYVNSNHKLTQELVTKAEKGGCKGLFITVDAPQLGKREKDMRMKFALETDVQKNSEQKAFIPRAQGAARAISSFIDPSLNWNDLTWFRSITKMPIVLKGIQCGADALLAAEHKVDAIVVSNHGGRQVDTCRSAIEILPEVMTALNEYYRNYPSKKMEVYIDGGIRRGSDIFKALALGAKAVGIGRPFLYAMSTYGQEGVEKAIDILNDELVMTMRLMGTPTLEDIRPSHVDARSLCSHSGQAPTDHWINNIYEPLPTPKL